jgi:hypothetical protein
MFKSVLLTTLVAAASAEAQFGYAYGAYPGYGYGAYPVAGAVAYAAAVPFGSSTGLDPITQGLDPVTQGVAIPAAAHYLGKRSADADAEAYYAAYPYSTYGAYPYAAHGAYPYAAYGAYPYAAAVPFGSSTGLDPITQGLDPVTQGVAIPAAAHYLGKRSADADADAYYAAYPYATYGAYPYAAHGAYAYAAHGAYPYAAAVPFGSSTGLDPITQGLDPVTQGVAIPAYAGYAYGK